MYLFNTLTKKVTFTKFGSIMIAVDRCGSFIPAVGRGNPAAECSNEPLIGAGTPAAVWAPRQGFIPTRSYH